VSGTPIVTAGGILAGFINAQGELTPAWRIAGELGTVLGQGQIVSRGFPWEGKVVHGVVSSTDSQPLTGWYVTKSPTRATAQTIGVGDVIVAIDDQAIDPTTLAETIAMGTDKMTFSILRNDRALSVTVNKSILK
jgi:hypothetical protein